MTDPRRQAWAPYIRDVADRLRLRDWTVKVKDDEPEDKDAHASVHCVYGRKLALVRLSAEFLSDAPEEQRHSVVHELLHCHLDDAYWYAYGRLESPEAKEAYQRFVEKGIDGLADAIAPLMPLPAVKVDSNGQAGWTWAPRTIAIPRPEGGPHVPVADALAHPDESRAAFPDDGGRPA